jgi:4-carboxymuconolactone decarboxylase
MTALTAPGEVDAQRGLGAEQLPPATTEFLPLDKARGVQRAARVRQIVRSIILGLEQFTTEVLFRDLWLRLGLSLHDRSLITIAALISADHVAQVAFHLNRAMDNGLTRAQRPGW